MTLLQPLVGKGEQDPRPTKGTCCGFPSHMDMSVLRHKKEAPAL